MAKELIYIDFPSEETLKLIEYINSKLEKKVNSDIRLTIRDLSELTNKVVAQLTYYIESYESTKGKWNFEWTVIPFTIYFHENKPNDFITAYYKKDKSKWLCFDNKVTDDCLTYYEFKQEIIKDIYISADTAIFYAFESYIKGLNTIEKE